MVAQKSRLSNIELLRFIAMLMILGLHANFLTFGGFYPNIAPFERAFLEQLCIPAVNVFVLISGWFSIKPSAKGFINLLFQVIFYYLSIFAILAALGKAQLSLDFIKSAIIIGGDYWFVTSYIVLYIVAPLLNRFIEHSNKHQIVTFLIIFYSIQTYYGWIFKDYEHFAYGYSAFSFIGLYVLARFLRLYGQDFKIFKLCKTTDLGFFLMITLLATIINIGLSKKNIAAMNQLSYNNPLVILQAVFLLLAFCKMSFKSKFVNWLGGSAFAIYLIHCHSLVLFPYFTPFIKSLDNGGSDVLLFFKIVGVLLIIAIACIVVDKFRILLWKTILKIGPLNRALTSFDEKFRYS